MDKIEKTVTKYSVFCKTEGKWVDTGYFEETPTKCPNDGTHSIESATEIDHISTKVSIVKEDDSGTQGNWRMESFTFDVKAGPGTMTTHSVSFPYPVKIYNLVALISDSNVGDEVEVLVGLDTHTGFLVGNESKGILTQDASVGSTKLSVDGVVLNTLNLGYRIKLKDPSKGESVGECIDIDKDNGTITVGTPTTRAFSAGTKVMFTVVRFKKFPLVNSQNIMFGSGKIGGSLLEEGISSVICYTNNGSDAKKFSGLFEIDY